MNLTLVVLLIAGQRTVRAFLTAPRCEHLSNNRCLELRLDNEDSSFGNQQADAKPWKQLQQQARNESLVRATLGWGKELEVVSVEFAGICELPNALSTIDPQLCITLTQKGDSSTPQPCLLVPLTREAHVLPIEAAAARTPISNPKLLRLNSIAVNRDEGLWDNLPWSLWTVDPSRRNYDAAGNPIDPKFHFGKRDAYNVMLGKDWFSFSSSSQAIALVMQQLKKLIGARDTLEQEGKTPDEDIDDDNSQSTLARRLLELQIRETQYSVAELDSQIAVLLQDVLSSPEDQGALGTLEFQREELLTGLEVMKEQLEELVKLANTQQQQTAALTGLIQRILDFVDKRDFNFVYERDPAPYRGATGYAPYQNSGDPATNPTHLFCSPFSLLLDIVENQLNAEVVGCVLENTSFLNTIALGGVVVLRRKSAKKEVKIDGQTFDVRDEDEDLGNEGVMGGETFLVECEADEALAISLACEEVPLQLEAGLWQQCATLAKRTSTKRKRRIGRELPLWKTVDPELSVLVEGQPNNQSDTERIAPIRIPRSTLSLFDMIMEPRLQPRVPNRGTQNVFPTDNPIKTLAALDKLSDQNKARTLLSMSNFQGRLPRPRVVDQSKGRTENPLDELLLPRIDESVRRQYLIRNAKQQGDLDLVRKLEAQKSKRQQLQEEAEKARLLGDEGLATQLDKEAKFFGSLRADVTQDVGSYSRFLDRDEWYERERRQTASRVDKKKFGTLLDGIE